MRFTEFVVGIDHFCKKSLNYWILRTFRKGSKKVGQGAVAVSHYRQGVNMENVTRLLIIGALVSISFVSVADSAEPDNEDALALSILKNLEVNTFSNSFRPAHYPDGTTISQTPYHVYDEVAGRKGVYSATDKERSWIYSVRVMKKSNKDVAICFIDHSLQGSYLTASPLLVRENRVGHYAVIKELSATPLCGITKT
ncbi:hypothetical protein ACYZUD_25920 [Pseudomonas sp. XS1P51]